MKSLSLLPSILFSLLFFCSCTKTPTNPVNPGTTGTGSNPGTGGNGVSAKPPVANAGPDQTVLLPQTSAILDAVASYDSLGRTMSFSWRMISGNHAVYIVNSNKSRAIVTNLTAGTYVFELNVSVIGAIDLDTLVVTVKIPDYCPSIRSEKPAQLSLLGTPPEHPALVPEMYVAGNKILIPQHVDIAWGSLSPLVNMYDIPSRSWSVITLPEARDAMAIITSGNKVFFAGGLKYDASFSNYTYSDRVDIYDITTNTWSLARLSEARGYCKAGLAGNKLVFAGGVNANHVTSDKVDILDLQNNSWSAARLAGGARAVVATVTAQNKILFCGGFSKFEEGGFGYGLTTPVRAIDIYDANSGQWTVGAMQSTRYQFTATSYQDKVFLAGGTTDFGPTFEVEILDAGTLQSSSSCLFTNNHFLSSSTACIKNNDIIFSPSPDTGPLRNKFDIYHTQTGTWSVGVFPPPVTSPPNSDYTAVVSVNNTVYVFYEGKLYTLTV